ncbi:MAG TPA: DUF898 family protein [Arthrobacter sp.]|nr:DUF898 family protein [Arthrobacter sp.]
MFGNWIKWLLLSVITIGIYLFWVGPRIAQWKWEHTDFDLASTPAPPSPGGPPIALPTPPGFQAQVGLATGHRPSVQ